MIGLRRHQSETRRLFFNLMADVMPLPVGNRPATGCVYLAGLGEPPLVPFAGPSSSQNQQAAKGLCTIASKYHLPTDMAAATLFGYDAVATCMNYDRDLAQHRRFGVLNARNLLCLQSELISLETQLAELDAQANDFTRGNDVWSMPRSWHALERAQNSEHLEVVLKIRDRLDIYSGLVGFILSSIPISVVCTSGTLIMKLPKRQGTAVSGLVARSKETR